MKLPLSHHERFTLAIFLFKNFTSIGAAESLRFSQLTEQCLPDLTREFLAKKATTATQLCPHCREAIGEPLAPDQQPLTEVEITDETAEFLATLLNRYQRTAEQAIVLSCIEQRLG